MCQFLQHFIPSFVASSRCVRVTSIRHSSLAMGTSFTAISGQSGTKNIEFDPHQFVKELNSNYKLENHRLSVLPFNESHCNINKSHFVLAIHNFLSPEESTLYQKRCRKLSERDLMKHGGRRHALYFDVKDGGLKKRTYRYGQQDWPMNNGIPQIQKDLLAKIEKEFGILFNGIVFNVYSSRKSHIWWHTDLQPGIGDVVCTFSTGRTEHLQFRAMHKPVIRGEDEQNLMNGVQSVSKQNAMENVNGTNKENEIVLNVPCHHGTLLIMSPGVNQFYQHRVDVPTESQLEVAMKEFQSVDRENTTMHFHFDETKQHSHLNLELGGGLDRILKHLSK